MKTPIVGAIIAILAGVGSNLGVNVQKLSHNNEAARPDIDQRPYHKRRIWWLGMFLVTFGSFGDFFALGFAPQTLVASLGGGSTILANVVFARLWLRQSLFLSDIIGVTLVVIGVIIAACASVTDKNLTIDDIYRLMRASQFIIYIFIILVVLICLHIKIQRTKREESAAKLSVSSSVVNLRERSGTDMNLSSEQRSPTTSGDNEFHGIASPKTDKSPQVPVEEPYTATISIKNETEMKDNMEQIEKGNDSEEINVSSLLTEDESKVPLYWAAMSGVLGGQSVLIAKCVMEMIFESVRGDNQFKYLGTYLLVIALLVTLFLQTHTLNLATMSGDTMSVFPVFQAFWIGTSNVSGIVFFQQAHEFTPLQWCLFPTALLLVMFGIFLIAKHQKAGKSRFKFLAKVF